jgi:hypothetical protein
MSKYQVKKKFVELIENTPHIHLIVHGDGESISTLYDPAMDTRFPKEIIAGSYEQRKVFKDAIRETLKTVECKGLDKVGLEEAEKTIAQSKVFYRDSVRKEKQPETV